MLAHDAEAQVSRIQAPTLLTFGRHDLITSTRFVPPLQAGIRGAELMVFESSAHAPVRDQVDDFNQQTLAFVQRPIGA